MRHGTGHPLPAIRSRHLPALDRLRAEEGQDFAEYALIFALLVTVVAIAFSPFGSDLGGAITNTVANIVGML